MKIFFSAGEPSGDLHGANLIRELQRRYPDLEPVGYGGPKMQAAGCQLHEDLTKLAVMWLLRVIVNLDKFWNLASRADRYFRHHKPDAVVLIDYPGFNWWIARRAKAHGIPVFYFAPPQVWAWATWRVRKMRRFVDHVLCSMPFEADWYAERGCNAQFVGHPYFDEVAQQRLDQPFIARQQAKTGRLVVILPGSRTQEVEQNLHWFLKAAEKIHAAEPTTRFAIASFKPHQADYARRMIAASSLPIEVHVGRTGELIHAAECCLAVSGSVSLELLYHAKPTVIHYHVSKLGNALQKKFRRVKYITLVNLLNSQDIFPRQIAPYRDGDPEHAGVLFPEYLTSGDATDEVARHALAWLQDDTAREDRVRELRELRDRIAHGGATKTAANRIVQVLSARQPQPIRTHYNPQAA